MIRRPTTTPQLIALNEFIERAIAAGIDMIQIREPDLSARQLCSVMGSAAKDAKILINDRADVAASSAGGVHLTTRSMPVEVVRAAFGSQILIGASTHTIDEVEAAEAGGADFVVFGPVFETPSKRKYGAPVGLDTLEQVAMLSGIPVLALGGVNLSNYKRALDAGAAGVAGISMFIEAMDLASLVAEIKSYV